MQRRLVVALGRTSATVLLSLPYAAGREALVAAGPLVDSLRAAGGEVEVVEFDPALVDVDPRLAALGASLFEALPAEPTPSTAEPTRARAMPPARALAER